MVGAKVYSNICLPVGRVSHSQKLREKPPTPWVIAEIGGKLLSAHCNCMARLGEVCPHIGAILFYCRAATEKKTQLLLLGRKHIGLFLQTVKLVLEKSLTLISLAQIHQKRMFQDQKKRSKKYHHLQHRLK